MSPGSFLFAKHLSMSEPQNSYEGNLYLSIFYTIFKKKFACGGQAFLLHIFFIDNTQNENRAGVIYFLEQKLAQILSI